MAKYLKLNLQSFEMVSAFFVKNNPVKVYPIVEY